jgi:general secretion pathway protein D
MRFVSVFRLAVLACASAGLMLAQAPPKIVQLPETPEQQPPQPQPPAQAKPAQPGQPAPVGVSQSIDTPRLTSERGFMLPGVSLTEMIGIIAKMLKINYILDPSVKGAVSIYTYGEVKDVDLMPLLQTILRVNGATMVKVGDLYHIIPIKSISNLPVEPVINADPKTLPDDERMVMNMIFLKYATAAEMDKLLKPFYGEGATSSTYDPANLLIIQDNSRSMKRTMELLAMFDADNFAGQRVKLYDIENSRPSDLVKELENVFKAYALSDKGSGAVKFLPVDRINTIIAVAPNPGVFADVEKWIEKLDVPVKITAGAVNNYVYRLKYGNAGTVAMAVMALYSGNPMALMQLSMMGMGPMGMGGGMGMGGYGMGGMGMGGYGMGGYGMGGMGMGGYGMGYGGMGAYSNFGGTPGAYGDPNGWIMSSTPGGVPAQMAAMGNPMAGGAASGLTGQYLAASAQQQQQSSAQHMPHVIPNPFDNTLLVQGTPQEWEQIRNLLRQLDVAPRQVLIDAKIYELDLTGAFASGVEAFLEKKDSGGAGWSRALNVVSNGAGVVASGGALVLRNSELMAAISLAESENKSRVIASPSIIATDSIPAIMNVGQTVPVLNSTGIAVTGSSFQSVSQQQTGTTLSVVARVNSSGIITLVINQNVSSPVQTQAATQGSNIDSPSFSTRNFSTQVTVQDGDTVAIGGFIQETKSEATNGIPVLDRVPLIGPLFGSKSYSKARTELVVFMTPRVIYDTSQISDATDEIRNSLKKLQKDIRKGGM